LDFVSKEVVRSGSEASVAALVAQASLERRHREAEESGRRQAEQLLRIKRQQQLEQTMADHALTADRFLQELMSKSVSRHAATRAQKESAVEPAIDAAAVAVAAAAAYAGEEGPDTEASELVLGDLVASFLLPEVERRKEARKKELEERRFVKLAHEAVFQAVQGMQPDNTEEQ
jgi:hypothetical protein